MESLFKDYYVSEPDCYIDKNKKIAVINGCKLVERMHSHKYIELVYIMKGEAEHYVNDEKMFFHQGDIFLLDMNCKHAYRATTPTIDVCNIIFLPEFLDYVFDNGNQFVKTISKVLLRKNLNGESSEGFYYIPKEQTGRIVPFIEELLRENEEQKEGYLKAMNLLLRLILINIFRTYEGGGEEIPKSQNEIVLNIIDYIKTHNNKDLSVNEIARAFFFSPDYLARIFKHCTAQTLGKYIHEEKMKKAENLLLTTKMTVGEIQERLGYKDAKYFYDTFVKYFGTTPGKYRKEKLKNGE